MKKPQKPDYEAMDGLVGTLTLKYTGAILVCRKPLLKE